MSASAGNAHGAPAGPFPEIRSLTAAGFVHYVLDKTFTEKVSEELDRPSGSSPAFRLGLRDRSIRRLLSMLEEELVDQVPFGRRYVDSLGHGLASRFLSLHDPVTKQGKPQVSVLPAPILRRVLEKIEANIERLVSEIGIEHWSLEAGHPFKVYLAINQSRQMRTQVSSPQTNSFCKRLQDRYQSGCRTP